MSGARWAGWGDVWGCGAGVPRGVCEVLPRRRTCSAPADEPAGAVAAGILPIAFAEGLGVLGCSDRGAPEPSPTAAAAAGGASGALGLAFFCVAAPASAAASVTAPRLAADEGGRIDAAPVSAVLGPAVPCSADGAAVSWPSGAGWEEAGPPAGRAADDAGRRTQTSAEGSTFQWRDRVGAKASSVSSGSIASMLMCGTWDSFHVLPAS